MPDTPASPRPEGPASPRTWLGLTLEVPPWLRTAWVSSGALAYGAAAVGALVVVCLRFARPDLIHNEAVYLVGILSAVDPSFLAHDELYQFGLGLARLYQYLMAPLWLWLGDWLTVAIVGRILGWIACLWPLALLARQAGLSALAFFVGFALWMGSSQCFAANEWLFGGTEQKCFAYAAGLGGLWALGEGRPRLGGLLCGVAMLFHPLIGAWVGLACGLALIFRWRQLGLAFLIRFALVAGLVSSPMLLSAIFYGAPDVAPVPGVSDAWILVVLRNPHHMDPYQFLTLERAAVGLALCAFSLATVAREARERFRCVALPFLCALACFYLLGIGLRAVGWLAPLRLMPFRTGDVLLPLTFCLTLAYAGGRLLCGVGRIDRRWLVHAAIVLVVVAATWEPGQASIRRLRASYGEFYWSWRAYAMGRPDDFERMASWIRQRLPEDARLLSPPCWARLHLETERAQVAVFRIMPANALLRRWYTVMTDINGGRPLQARGWDLCVEITESYRKMSRAQVEMIGRKYDADFFLTEIPRDDLGLQPLHAVGPWRLYSLAARESGPGTDRRVSDPRR